MVSLRLITTGLDDVHSVIGYELCTSNLDCNKLYAKYSILIQPPKGAHYSYEAMHDINGISIPQLIEVGVDRESTISDMFSNLYNKRILVWYKPFIMKFIRQVEEEFNLVSREDDYIDLYTLAKQKEFNPPSYKLADVYEYTKTDNLFDLYDYLKNLPEPKRRSRV